MRARVLVLALAVAVLMIGNGLAVAAFTTHQSTPQTFVASEDFRPPDVTSLLAQSKTNDGGQPASQIQLGLLLRNTGTERVALDTVTMRYWYTADEPGGQQANCYYSTFGCSKLNLNVRTLTAAKQGADHYLEVGFRSGRLNAGEQAELNQLAVLNQIGGRFDQLDDHSFLDRSVFTDNPRVTVYIRGELVWGTEPGPLPLVEEVSVRYANGSTDPHNEAIQPHLMVVDAGTVPIELQEVTLRYWFTRDGGTAQQLIAFCDFAEIGCNDVNLSLVGISPRPGADTYLQVGFDPGMLQIDDSTGPMQIRVHHGDYSPFDETDDYSWALNTQFENTVTVTAYLRGKLVWGVEP